MLLASLRRGSTLFFTIGGKSQIFQVLDQKHAQSIVFLLSWVFTPVWSHRVKCTLTRVNFQSASRLYTRWTFSNCFFLFSRCLYLLVEVFTKGLDPEHFSDESRGIRKNYMCLSLFGCSIWRFTNKWRCKLQISITSSFMERVFSLCIQQKWCGRQKHAVWSKLSSLACWCQKKKEERYEATQLCV